MQKTLLSIFLLLNTTLCMAQQHQWVRTNPGGGGSFGVVGADITGVIYAGSDLSGVYRSQDGGNTFDVIGAANGLTATHISGLGFHRSNANIVCFGTDNGLFRSTDKGNSVTKISTCPGLVVDIKFATNNPSIAYASSHPTWNATQGSIYRSSNAGQSWLKVSNGLPEDIFILKIIIDPTNANTLYFLSGKGRFACGPADVYKSINGGLAWTNLTESLPEVLDIELSPSDPNLLYLTTMNASCNTQWYSQNAQGNLYKSINGGLTWNILSDYTGIIFLTPNDPQTIHIIDPRFSAPWESRAGTWKSTNGGIGFTRIGITSKWDLFFNGNIQSSYQSSYNGIVKTIQQDLSDPNTYYWTNYQWIFKTTDNGAHFTNIHTKEVKPGFWRSTGFDNVNMLDMSISKANSDIIYLGYFDIGIWRSLDHGESWQPCTPNKYGWSTGIGGNTATIKADPDRANIVWASSSVNQKGTSPTYLLKNANTGERNSWIESMNGLPKEQIMGLSIDAKSSINKRTLYVTAQQYVYKSIDDGASWNKVSNIKGSRFTAVDYYNNNLVYAAGENGVWRSENAGVSWEDISIPEMKPTGANFYNSKGVFDLKVDPNNPNWVYVVVIGSGKGLYKSTDKGTTWKKILTDNYMRKVAIAPNNSNILYVTMSSAFDAGGYNTASKGIMYSFNCGATWEQAIDGMAYPFGMVVEVDYKANPTVFVGSLGTGFQKSLIPSYSNNDKLKQNNAFKVYPNPFTQYVTVDGEILPNNNLYIYNEQGQEIYKELMQKTINQIDLSSYENGIYFFSLKKNTGNTNISKVPYTIQTLKTSN